MPDSKISQLPVAMAFSGEELIPVVQEGATVQANAGSLVSYLSTRTVSTTPGIMIPFYKYPNNPYTDVTVQALLDLIRRYPTIPMIVVVNPSNGAGAVEDGNYTALIRLLKAAGAKVCGYVSTAYAVRAEADVLADIDAWLTIYADERVDGIFLDEQPYNTVVGSIDAVALYRRYTGYAHTHALHPVIANPGTNQRYEWFDQETADIIIVHENSTWPDATAMEGNYINGHADFRVSMRAALVYGQASVNATLLRELVQYVKWVYLTEDSGANPWDTLSGLLEAQMEVLGSFADIGSSLVTATGTTTARSLATRFGEVFNIRDFGAVGDGSTANQVAIQAAIDAASAAGGGTVVVPAASAAYMIGAKLVLKSNVFLHIDPGATIKLANSSNCTMIEGLNFLTLSGTNSGSGVSNCGVIGYGVLDANRANNASPGANEGHGIAIYGRDFHICVRIKNTRRRGLHTEYGNGAVGTSPFNGYIERLQVDSSGEDGWYNKVSDLHCSGANIRSAGLNTDNTYDGIYLGVSGAIRGGNINVWTGGSDTSWPRAALYVACEGATVDCLHLETGKTANLIISGTGNQVSNMEAYNFKGDANVIVKGLANRVRGRLVRGALGIAASRGLVFGESGADTPFGNYADVYVSNHESGLVDFTYSTGANRVDLSGDQGAGTLIAGWTLNSDLIFGRVSGAAGGVLSGGRGTRAVQIGDGCSAAAADTVTLGKSCTAGSSGGISVGNTCTSSSTNAAVFGTNSQATSASSLALGQRAKTTVAGEMAMASWQAAATGDRQISTFPMAATTTDATATELSTSGTGTLTRLVLENTSILDCVIELTGVDTADRTKVYRAEYRGAIKRDASAATTAFVNAGPSSTIDAANPAGWASAVSADTANGSLKILVTGAAATTIAWFARVTANKIVG